jgi:hypothetical protein
MKGYRDFVIPEIDLISADVGTTKDNMAHRQISRANQRIRPMMWISSALRS